MLLLGFYAWSMCWGFAGRERHFGAQFSFLTSGSAAWVNTPNLNNIAVVFALWCLVAGCLIATPVLFRKRNFSLQRLIASCALAGMIGALPLAGERFEPTVGSVVFSFDTPLAPAQVAAMLERLQSAAVSIWQPPATLGVTPPTQAEFTRILYEVKVSDWEGRVNVGFRGGMGFSRRAEIAQFLIAYVESVATEYAVKAGLPPIEDKNRQIEHRRFEK